MIVVTGATGNVGRPLVRALAEAGEDVIAVSRTITPGPRQVQADLADPASLKPTLEGADALFVLVSGAGAHVDAGHLVEVTKAAGVRRVVLLSSQGAATRASHAPLRVMEDAIKESGLDWTFLRPGGFHSNAFQWAEQVRTRRTVAAPFADVALPTVDPSDLAAVAAKALRGGHAGQTYELTGPAPVSPRDQAQAIGDALGAPVRFVEQTPEEARAIMLGFMPEPVVEGTLAILGSPTPAEQQVSPAVEQLLDRPAGAFATWATRNIAAFT